MEGGIIMFEMIKKQVQTLEGISYMSKQDMYYAYKWIEEGAIELPDECFTALIDQMCISGM